MVSDFPRACVVDTEACFAYETRMNHQILHLHRAYQKLLALKELSDTSSADVIESSRILSENPQSQFWRRIMTRNFAAHVEGLIYLMKIISLDLQQVMGVNFTTEEQDQLREYSSKTNRPLFLGFFDNFKFAYDCFARVSHSSFKLTFDTGYDCFREMVKTRDSLMHPKSVGDLEVSDAQTQAVCKAWDWHQRQTVLLFSDTLAAFQEYEKQTRKVS
jgi:hypothetical protein